MVSNQVTRAPGGTLIFGDMNYARTAGPPSWLSSVRSAGDLSIRLVVQPRPVQSQYSASIIMLASDTWHTDFSIAQDQSSLVLWLLRPGSDADGAPPYVVTGVFRPGRPVSVQLTISSGRVRILVNGAMRFSVTLPAGFTRSWGPGLIAFGDEVHGGIPWQGKISQAEVLTPGHGVDYLSRGALSVPARYFYLPDHVDPFPPPYRSDWLRIGLHGLSFLPVGFLLLAIRWRRPVLSAVACGTLLAIGLAAGKFLFYGRHITVAATVAQVAGVLLGMAAARRFSPWSVAHGPVPREPAAGSQPAAGQLS